MSGDSKMRIFERYLANLRAQGKSCRVITITAVGKKIVEVNHGESYFVWDFNNANKRSKDFKTFEEACEYCRSSWL